MTYKLVECKHCHRLSIHRGEKVFRCPYCGRDYKLNKSTVIFESADFKTVFNYKLALEESAGKKAHLEVFRE